MAVTDQQFQDLESTVTALSEAQDTNTDALADMEQRLTAVEQTDSSQTSRLNALEQGKMLTLDSVYAPLYHPFYTAGDVVQLGTATAVHIPNDYGGLYLRADPNREFNGFELLVTLDTPLTGTGLVFQNSSGAAAIAATAFSTAGTYSVKRINNVWKTCKIGSGYVIA